MLSTKMEWNWAHLLFSNVFWCLILVYYHTATQFWEKKYRCQFPLIFFLYMCHSIDVIWHCDIFCTSPETFCSHLPYICELSCWPTALVSGHRSSGMVHPVLLNSLAPGGFDNSMKLINFKLISTIDILSIFWEIAIRWMPQHLTDY